MNDRLCWFMIYAVFAMIGFFVAVFPLIIFFAR